MFEETGVVETPVETPSGETAPVETPSTETTETIDDKPVPYSRFKEVNDQLKELKEMVKPTATSKKDLTAEQLKEEQAKEYLSKLVDGVLTSKEQAKKLAQENELKEFKQQLSDVLAVNTDIKRGEFEKFLEKEGDDYSSLNAAAKAFKRLSEAEKSGVEKGKESLKGKPKMPTHEGIQIEAPAEDKGKSIRQIAEEAIGTLTK